MSSAIRFLDTLSAGVHALSALVAALHQHGQERGVWRDFAVEQAHGELEGLRGRLLDTTPEDWRERSARSWLSPRDVGEIRDGVVTLDRLVGAQSVPLLPAERADLEQLAALLERYLADDVLP